MHKNHAKHQTSLIIEKKDIMNVLNIVQNVQMILIVMNVETYSIIIMIQIHVMEELKIVKNIILMEVAKDVKVIIHFMKMI